MPYSKAANIRCSMVGSSAPGSIAPLRMGRRAIWMLRQGRRVILGALLALVALAGSAAAECAWVLWAKLSNEWNLQEAFEKRAECTAAGARFVQSLRDSGWK